MCEHCARREACQRPCETKPSVGKALAGLLIIPVLPLVLLNDVLKSLRARKKHNILWNTEPQYRQMVLLDKALQKAFQRAMNEKAAEMARQVMETVDNEQS